MGNVAFKETQINAEEKHQSDETAGAERNALASFANKLHRFQISREAAANIWIGLKSKPAMLFNGPAGSGKDALSQAVAEAIVGEDALQCQRFIGHPWWASGSKNIACLVNAQQRFTSLRLQSYINEISQAKDPSSLYFAILSKISRAELHAFFAEVFLQARASHGFIELPNSSYADPISLPDCLYLIASFDLDRGYIDDPRVLDFITVIHTEPNTASMLISGVDFGRGLVPHQPSFEGLRRSSAPPMVKGGPMAASRVAKIGTSNPHCRGTREWFGFGPRISVNRVLGSDRPSNYSGRGTNKAEHIISRSSQSLTPREIQSILIVHRQFEAIKAWQNIPSNGSKIDLLLTLRDMIAFFLKHHVAVQPGMVRDAFLYIGNAWDTAGHGLLHISNDENARFAYELWLQQSAIPRLSPALKKDSRLRDQFQRFLSNGPLAALRALTQLYEMAND